MPTTTTRTLITSARPSVGELMDFLSDLPAGAKVNVRVTSADPRDVRETGSIRFSVETPSSSSPHRSSL